MNPSISTSISNAKPRSRRALLAGAMGGLGAWAASAFGRASHVRAQGETVVVGGQYDTATSVTRLRNVANNSVVFWGESQAGGVGVEGRSDSNIGVEGISSTSVGVKGFSGSTYGVYGSSTSSIGVGGFSSASMGVHGLSEASHGVMGSSDSRAGVRGNSNDFIGVYGTTIAPDRSAVAGQSQNEGTGVFGYSGESGDDLPSAEPKTGVLGQADQDADSRGVWGRSDSGVGVYAQGAATGWALEAAGRAKFSTSGVATIASGLASVTVAPNVDITSESFVLLSAKSNLGGRQLWFTTDAAADTFTIHMSSARSKNTRVAWLLLG
jgi:hypothetical protein